MDAIPHTFDLWLLALLAPLEALQASGQTSLGTGASLALVVGLVFTAALVRGLAGFGFPLVLVSIMALLYPPAFVVPLVVILQASFGVLDLARIRSKADWPLLGRVVVGSLLGAPLGVLVLMFVPEVYLRMILGLAIMVAAYALLRGFSLKAKAGPRAQFATGIVCGFAHSSAAMSGPPAVFMLLASQTDPERARATLFALYALVAWVAIIAMRLAGAIDAQNLVLGLSLLPVMYLGFEVGKALYKSLEPKFFRPVATLVLMATGLVLLLKSLWAALAQL